MGGQRNKTIGLIFCNLCRRGRQQRLDINPLSQVKKKVMTDALPYTRSKLQRIQ